MTRVSRRQLAHYATEELKKSSPVAVVARQLAAELITSRRLSELDMLLGDIAYELETRGLLVEAIITSKTALDETLRNELKAFLVSATKADSVVIDEYQDNSVLGGLRIETATTVWDATLAHKLTNLRSVI